jgi:hypothetical protein
MSPPERIACHPKKEKDRGEHPQQVHREPGSDKDESTHEDQRQQATHGGNGPTERRSCQASPARASAVWEMVGEADVRRVTVGPYGEAMVQL